MARWPVAARWATRAAAGLGLLLALLLALRLWPHAPLREQLALSTPLYDRHGSLLRLTLAPDEQYRLWTPLDAIAPPLVQATHAL